MESTMFEETVRYAHVRRGRLRLTLNFYQLARWMVLCEVGAGSTATTPKEFILK